jgi:hypothetical protein
MKNLSLVFSLALALSLTIATQVSAQDVSALSLKNNMKQSGILLKQITTTLSNASQNAANAASVAKIITFMEAAKTQSPDTVTNGSLADYQSLMTQEIAVLKELQTAFLSNDNTAALNIAQRINSLKKEGHDKYK